MLFFILQWLLFNIIEWENETTIKRIGFERVEVEWRKVNSYSTGRISFELNNKFLNKSIEYEWEKSKL